MKSKETKHLRFELTVEEYAEFWKIGSLLNLNKKHPILLKMMEVIKAMKVIKELRQ